jgi:hypothetical protein
MPLANPDLTEFTTVGQSLTNYSWTELASGTGYQVFYLGNVNNAAAYVTLSNVFSSETIKTVSIENLTVTETKFTDINMDIVFNKSVTVGGNLFVNCPIGVNNASLNGESAYMRLKVSVYHYDGSTETQLGSTAEGKQFYSGALNVSAKKSYMASNMVAISTPKVFAAGETLRITLEGWFKVFGGTARDFHVGLGHDPAGRADNIGDEIIDSDTSTICKAQVPFDVEDI